MFSRAEPEPPRSHGWKALTQLSVADFDSHLEASSVSGEKRGRQGQTMLIAIPGREGTATRDYESNGDPSYEGVHHRTGRKDLQSGPSNC